MPSPLPVTFAAGHDGSWMIERVDEVRGETLAAAPRLAVIEGRAGRGVPASAAWVLRGVTSNERYVTRSERDALETSQPRLGRPAATEAALIPIKKSSRWWDLAQDERREIFEEASKHVLTGLKHLPAVARRLHHSRDLGEPFDFLTWFEFAPEDRRGFEELAATLRGTEEWQYVEREVDIRLRR